MLNSDLDLEATARHVTKKMQNPAGCVVLGWRCSDFSFKRLELPCVNVGKVGKEEGQATTLRLNEVELCHKGAGK